MDDGHFMEEMAECIILMGKVCSRNQEIGTLNSIEQLVNTEGHRDGNIYIR